MKINLTRLLEVMLTPGRPLIPTTDASYLPISKDRTSPHRVYGFELEDTADFGTLGEKACF